MTLEEAFISMEYCGSYTLELSLFLDGKIPFCLVPPLEIIRSIGIARGKNNGVSVMELNFSNFITPSGGEELKVKVGKCNINQDYDYKVLTLGRKIPEAELSIEGGNCIPVSTDEVTISNVAKSGLVYEWILGGTNFTFASGSQNDDPNGITIHTNGKAGYVVLTSKPDPLGSTYCSEIGLRYDTVRINRVLTSNLVITGDECVAQGEKIYSLDELPGEDMTWDFPDGWEIVGGSANENAAPIRVEVGPGAQSGTVTVSTKACPAVQIQKEVYVQPAQPEITAGDNCVTPNALKAHTSTTTSANGYTWDFPDTWTCVSGCATNNPQVLVGSYTPSQEYITVTAVGEIAGCD